MDTRKWWLVAVGLVLVTVLAGCDRDGEEEAAQDGAVEGEEVDELGEMLGKDGPYRSEEWPEEVERIVSMAPNITEVLFELGYGEEVVGVTRYCDWPREVELIATVGGMLDPDYEAMLAQEPDLVLGVVDGADHRMLEGLESAGVAYGFVSMDDINGIKEGIRQVGEWLGGEERADEVIAEFEKGLAAQSEAVGEALGAEGLRALMVYDREPVVAAGPGTFGEEILELLSMSNALGEESSAYPVLDMEAVLAADPEVVLDVKMGGDARGYWERYGGIDAVANERVFHIDDPLMMRPGPRLPEALKLVGEAMGDK